MNASAERTLFWTPRVLLILSTLFVSVFALDVFGEGLGVWGTLLALAIHLIPTFALLLVFLLVWKSEPLGGALSALFGVVFFFYFMSARWTVLLIVSGMPILAGVLLWSHWGIAGRNRPAQSFA